MSAAASSSSHPQHEPDPTVLEPFAYLTGMPGKDVRGKLIDCFSLWLPLTKERSEAIKLIVGELHNASQIHPKDWKWRGNLDEGLRQVVRDDPPFAERRVHACEHSLEERLPDALDRVVTRGLIKPPSPPPLTRGARV